MNNNISKTYDSIDNTIENLGLNNPCKNFGDLMIVIGSFYKSIFEKIIDRNYAYKGINGEKILYKDLDKNNIKYVKLSEKNEYISNQSHCFKLFGRACELYEKEMYEYYKIKGYVKIDND